MKQKSIQLFSRDFFRNSIVHWLTIAVVFLNLINWGIMAFYIKPVNFPVFLRYNINLGVDMMMVGRWQDAFMFPAIGLVFLVINWILALHFFNQKERIASYVLLIAAIMVQIATIIAGIGVILINY